MKMRRSNWERNNLRMDRLIARWVKKSKFKQDLYWAKTWVTPISTNDKTVLCDEIMNPKEPNAALQDVAEQYKEEIKRIKN